MMIVDCYWAVLYLDKRIHMYVYRTGEKAVKAGRKCVCVRIARVRRVTPDGP